MSCKKSLDKKYLTRPSPPYPANLCCGQIKKGNSGDMYMSRPDKNGVCRWYHVSPSKKSGVKGLLHLGEKYKFKIDVIDENLSGTIVGQLVDIVPGHGHVDFDYVVTPLKVSSSLLKWSHPYFTDQEVVITHIPGNKVNPFSIGDEADVKLIK